MEVSGAAKLSGGTLTNVVTTPGTGTLQIDSSQTLTLSGETISGGTIAMLGVGLAAASIDVIAASTINDGATLNGGSVTMNARLTLDGTSSAITVNNTAFTTEAGHSLRIVGPVTLDDSAITDDGHVTIGTTTTPATLTVDDGTSINGSAATGTGNGVVTINSGSTLDIEVGQSDVSAAPDATLDGVAVTDNNVIEVGISTLGAILLLDGGTTITGNSLAKLQIGNATSAVDGTGEVDVEGSSPVTLANINVTALAGSMEGIEVGVTTAEGTLILKGGTTMTGGALTIGAAPSISNPTGGLGTVDVEDGGATLSGVAVNTAAGAVEVGQSTNSTLTLDGGTVMTDGTLTIGSLNNGTAAIAAGGVTLNDVAVNMSDSGKLNIGVGAAGSSILTVDDGTSITGGTMTIGSTGELDVEKGASGPGATLDGVDVTVNSSGSIEIDALGTTPATLTLDGGTSITGGTLTFGNASDTIDVEDASGATLDNVDVSGGGAIEVGQTNTATLTLDGGTTITAGTLTISAGSALDVQSPGGATLTGVAITNTGIVEVVSNTLVINNQSGGSFTNFVGLSNGTLKVDNGATLDLENATISGGIVAVHGTLEGTGASVISDAAITVYSDGVLEATTSGGTLTIDPGTLTNSGVLEVTSGATLIIDNNVTDGSTPGSLEISGTGTLELGVGVTTDEALNFVGAGPGTLKLDTDSAISAARSAAAASAPMTLLTSPIAARRIIWSPRTRKISTFSKRLY